MRDFINLRSFSAHLVRLAAESTAVVEHAAKHGAEIIAEQAKEQLGHYQEAAGPYQAWQKLADSTIAAHNRLGVGESPELVTGALYASIESYAHGATGVAGSTSPIMEYQEFGTPRIPPRPIMGMAAVTAKDKLEHETRLSLAGWIAARGWKKPRIHSDRNTDDRSVQRRSNSQAA